jgi:hypothetical protein
MDSNLVIPKVLDVMNVDWLVEPAGIVFSILAYIIGFIIFIFMIILSIKAKEEYKKGNLKPDGKPVISKKVLLFMIVLVVLMFVMGTLFLIFSW